MKRFISIIIFVILNSLCQTNGQNAKTDSLFNKFVYFYGIGDLLKSQNALIDILEQKIILPNWYKAVINNNLCMINTTMGLFDRALEYNSIAQGQMQKAKLENQNLADIYINRAYIYNSQKSYISAIEYFEKGIRIYQNQLENKSKDYFQNLSAAYLNIGVVYYELKNYKTAEEYFNKSGALKNKYSLQGSALIYLNIAKTVAKTGNAGKADKYYKESISSFIKEYGRNYYRLIDVFFDYGIFLRSQHRAQEAMKIHRKALNICLENYGKKHTFTSLAYKHIGDDFMERNNCDSALFYYQRSLISIVRNFNDTSIYSNPSIGSSIFDIRLLDNLKSKAKALELLAERENDPGISLKATGESVSTMDLALQLIDRIRNNYPTEESRIYLAENEKETYFFAVQMAEDLYKITNKESDIKRMYGIVQRSKAAVLRNEITQNELFYTSAIPDSIRNAHNNLSGNISAYNYLIQQEENKKDPDSKKIALWKDALFEMNRELEKNEAFINTEYPGYHELIERTLPVTAEEVMNNLGKNETVVDYLLSNTLVSGKRHMYIFTISRDNISYKEEIIDSLFAGNVNILRNWDDPNRSEMPAEEIYKDRTRALSYMYQKLIKPVEPEFKGNQLIIIPDEELAWLPFDAFLLKMPGSSSKDYDGLEYLILKYAVSYRYVSSQLLKVPVKLSNKERVDAFSPDYRKSSSQGSNLTDLKGAGDEINEVVSLLGGRKFTGQNATVSNFRKVMHNRSVLHLAMHSLSDSSNSRYSYLIFSPDSTDKNGRLYNYEISLSRIESPMVVLSACNSGTGTLYHGEGLMSLARGFILAGASSVVKTSWEVNDETSERIISGFYSYLASGKSKDEALRLAKLDYIKNSPPVYTDPYYWAAYEVVGDNAPVIINRAKYFIIGAIGIVFAVSLLLYYLRRRRSLSARSL